MALYNQTCMMFTEKPLLFSRITPYQTISSIERPHFLRMVLSRSPMGFSSFVPVTRNGAQIVVKCGYLGENDDGFYMRRCVEVAKKAIGCTSPNPMVGCVIVKDGKIVGEGFHPKAGQPHAEVFALRDAGAMAEQATAYVSLEPCNHYGRTPPCTEALIRAKVKRVVVGMVDPNPIVTSKGVERLIQSGISVTVGVEEKLCRRLNEAYIHRMLTGKPCFTLRYSLSFNGQILNHIANHDEEPGSYYSKLLQEYDSVIVSESTLTNNPFFLSLEPGAKQPLRIILAKTLNFNHNLSIFNTEAAPTLILANKSLQRETKTESFLSHKGVEIVVLDRIDAKSILELCSKRGFCSVLMDLRGGKLCLDHEILRESLKESLLQKVVVEVCGVIGGAERDHLVGIERELRLERLQSWASKDSIVMEGYVL
ncbi:hypothetical protein AMTRI_Chr07g80850 [Amborella trichopoda]